MEHSGDIVIEFHIEDGIGRMVLNAPPLNIISRELMAEVRKTLSEASRDRSLRVLVISAEGKHFSAGADVKEHLPPEYGELIPEFVSTIEAVDSFPLPTIAAVQGKCLGGGFELVQPVDMVLAEEGASFGQPEIMLGVLPPAACVLLPHLSNRGIATEIVFTGEAYSAAQAREAGLVLRVVPAGQLEQAALELAGRVARHSAATLRLTKRSVMASRIGSRVDALRAVGRIYTEALMATEDALEGLNSFLEKRKPAWQHR